MPIYIITKIYVIVLFSNFISLIRLDVYLNLLLGQHLLKVLHVLPLFLQLNQGVLLDYYFIRCLISLHGIFGLVVTNTLDQFGVVLLFLNHFL